MHLLLLTDIHGNLPALKAVLDHTRNLKADGILSLGDHLNYGPMPGETLALLKDAGVKLLMGNHEERLVRLRAGDRELCENYNWAMLRWTNRKVPGEPLAYPRECTVGDIFLTHAVPGDLNRLIRKRDTREVDRILHLLPQKSLVCGHNHIAWRYKFNKKEFVCLGSLGLLEDGQGRRASYAHLIDGRVELCSLPYDPGPLKRAFVDSGLASVSPEFARTVLQVMHTGEEELGLKFIKAAQQAEKACGMPWHSREAFHLAAESFPWTEDLSCDEFWKRL